MIAASADAKVHLAQQEAAAAREMARFWEARAHHIEDMVAPVAEQERDCEARIRKTEDDLYLCQNDVTYLTQRVLNCESSNASNQ